MSNVTSKPVKTLLTLLVAALGVFGLTTATFAATETPTETAPAAQPVCGDTSSYDLVPLGDLPPEAEDTADLIAQGGPFPYPQDGTVFQNREDLLPDCAEGYYHEYTVETPGSDHRGARRIVTGSEGEHFYTADHYASFVLIDLGGAPSECGDPTGIDEAGLSTLPAEVADTIALVQAGGPYPYPEDGQTYENREGVLPDCAAGYYSLYTVPTPGAPDRGERRLVAGDAGEFYYTPDRYGTFVHVNLDG
ncbi:ribonuclease domain-containing protein [Actinophytocola gossypii]|uniref:Ribonuclease n=1 Tax=Actinophytocola gossypii TaxID=2812003 RepID=A0ABT2JA90_9PSEU|nr:ribonuclease domain-containing protein [Actinophytocola gossypii]MCT2584772.1 ribonuclease [Actinophytocola gossypii]